MERAFSVFESIFGDDVKIILSG
jgi:hypothetical protein